MTGARQARQQAIRGGHIYGSVKHVGSEPAAEGATGREICRLRVRE